MCTYTHIHVCAHIYITSRTCGFLHSTPSFKNPLYQALALIAKCLDYKGSTRFPLCSEGMRGLREERGAGMRGSSACAPTGGGSRGPTGRGGLPAAYPAGYGSLRSLSHPPHVKSSLNVRVTCHFCPQLSGGRKENPAPGRGHVDTQPLR